MEKNDKKFETIVEITNVQENDSERIWEIRNNSLVRKNSGNPKVISLNDHEKWFHSKYFENKNNFCFVLRENKIVVGYCRFDYDEEKKAYVVSIAIDPEKHGKGLGNYLLSQSLSKLKEKNNNKLNIKLSAEVKKDNIPSIIIFKKNGFKKIKEDKKMAILRSSFI